MADWLLDGIIKWLAKGVVDMFGGLLTLFTAMFFLSPDVTTFPQVEMLANRVSTVVNAAFVLAIIAAGAVGMTHGTVQIRYSVKDLLPRLVFGVVASNFGVEVCRMLIDTSNALVVAMAGETSAGRQVFDFVKTHMIAAMKDPGAAVLVVVIGWIIVVLFYLLALQFFSRLLMLIILAGVAPAAFACYCLPYTQPIAALWWRSMLGCLAVPVLQATVFSVGVNLLLDPKYNVPALLNVPGTETLNLFLAAFFLWMTARIPKLVARYATRAGHKSATGGVVIGMVVSQITRHLPVRVPRLRRR